MVRYKIYFFQLNRKEKAARYTDCSYIRTKNLTLMKYLFYFCTVFCSVLNKKDLILILGSIKL